MTGITMPVVEYTHVSGGCSITGGFVYRGRVSPGLRGNCIYGDYCSGRIWGLERQGSSWSNRQLLASGFGITTFGEDEAGEIYVANAGNGSIHRIEGSRAPRLSAAGVVNTASFAAGMVPGSLATAFAAGVRDDPGSSLAAQVPLKPDLDGVSVTVGGIAAPVYSVSNVNGQEQVSFQVPFGVAGRSTAPVVVTRDGQASTAVEVPVAAVQPGVYTAGGTVAIAVHVSDNTLATAASPLTAGEYAFVYVSGLGTVSECARGWSLRTRIAAGAGGGRCSSARSAV